METLGHLAHGFSVALTPINLLWAFVGVTLGTAIGVLPGLGPALTIALLLPLTYKVSATAAFILFAGIYYGAMYGGSTTSILLNTPGESATIVTSLEGNKMAKRGRAGAALATAAIGSFVAGTIGTIGLTFLAGPVVELALKFGPAEYFSLMVLAFVTVSAVLGSSAIKGLICLSLGIFLGLIGIDLQTGQPRFTFGITELLDGINVIVVAVGLFAVGETLYLAAYGKRDNDEVLVVKDFDLDEPRGLAALRRPLVPRLRDRLSDRRDAGRRRGNPDVPVLLAREAPHEAPRGVRPRRHRGRGGSRGRQQRVRRRRSRADAGARSADLGDRRDHALGLPELRHQPRPAASRATTRSRLGPDRLALYRQRHAAGAEPAAGRPMGADPAHTPAAPLRRHPHFCDHRHLRHLALGGGPIVPLRHGRRRAS